VRGAKKISGEGAFQRIFGGGEKKEGRLRENFSPRGIRGRL